MRVDFFLSNDGGAFALAPKTTRASLETWLDGSRDTIRQRVEQGQIMPLGTYQDDGFFMRVVVGDMQPEEQADWTASASAMLDLTGGTLIISGALDQKAPSAIPTAQDGARYDICAIALPPARYTATVYSYPPHDLSGSWLRIVGPARGKTYLGTHPQAEALGDYVQRTRPNASLPTWVSYELGQTDYSSYLKNVAANPYISFLVHLTPFQASVPVSSLRPDGVLTWCDRKPAQFPFGIRMFHDIPVLC